jgi:hypothetical protein
MVDFDEDNLVSISDLKEHIDPDGKTTYIGVADAHGIESFLLARDNPKMWFSLRMRANLNRQRHAIFYIADLTENQVKMIKHEIDNECYKRALELILLTENLKVPQDHISSLELIPNDALDPYNPDPIGKDDF